MWQQILAVDSRLSEYRPMDRNYRSLYLKRRLQLLQNQAASKMDDPDERDEATIVNHRWNQMLQMFNWKPYFYGKMSRRLEKDLKYGLNSKTKNLK